MQQLARSFPCRRPRLHRPRELVWRQASRLTMAMKLLALALTQCRFLRRGTSRFEPVPWPPEFPFGHRSPGNENKQPPGLRRWTATDRRIDPLQSPSWEKDREERAPIPSPPYARFL